MYLTLNKSIKYKFALPLLLGVLSGCAQKNFYADTQVQNPIVYQQLQKGNTSIDSVMVAAGPHYKRGAFYNFLWGSRHRNAWTAPVTVPVLHPDTVKGGLTIEKTGGGMQTIKATMVSGNGKVYALRSVDKRPELHLPSILKRSFAADITLDQSSALNPYAALVVAPLAKASGIPSPSPKLYYARPNEVRFGKYKDLLSDRLYMLEEKLDDKRSLTGSLAGAHDVLDTKEMLANYYAHQNHFIDQLAYAKARLFDLLIGDRDRHEDQWEWAAFREDDHVVYRPIPKDRDNAFFRFDDGVLSWLLSRKWTNRKFESFDGKYRDVKALMLKSEYLDSRALTAVTAQQYDSLARVLQSKLTDEVIRYAVNQLPPSVYAIQGQNLEQNLRSRRNDLHKAAHKFYTILSEEIVIRGTEKSDYFKLTRLSDNETRLTISGDTNGKVTYQRTFNRTNTKKIRIEALGGDDVLEISGKARKGIKVFFSGGPGEDKVIDHSQGKVKRIVVQD